MSGEGQEHEKFRRRVEAAAAMVRERLPANGTGKGWTGLILGTGLGALSREISGAVQIPYDEIPGWPASTAPGHSGILHCGFLAGCPVLAMEGRFHLYEGYSPSEVTLPVRLFARLGVKSLVISNACGGMNRKLKKGDLVVLNDHINLMGVNPLVGRNIDEWGPRFPDMSQPYDRERNERLLALAREEGIRAVPGVYAGVLGPNLETAAEYRMLSLLGADVVGMSTIPEVIVAAHEGMRCTAISIVTDLCFPEELKPVSVEEILQVAAEAEPKFTKLVRRFLAIS